MKFTRTLTPNETRDYPLSWSEVKKLARDRRGLLAERKDDPVPFYFDSNGNLISVEHHGIFVGIGNWEKSFFRVSEKRITLTIEN